MSVERKKRVLGTAAMLVAMAAFAGGQARALEARTHAAGGQHVPAGRAPAGHAESGHVAGGHIPGYLGVEFKDTPAKEAAALHLRKGSGVEILMVDHDGPAGAAGLRPHDILVQLNGQLIAGAAALRRMIHEAGAGASVALALVRDGRTVTLTTHLADREVVERKAWQESLAGGTAAGDDSAGLSGTVDTGSADGESAEDGSAGDGSADPAPQAAVHGESFLGEMLHMGPYTGVVMQDLGPQLAMYFGSPKGKGLLVCRVEPGSPAAAAGLQAGDVVTQANGVAMRSTSDWNKRLRAAKGHPLVLVVLRDKRPLTLTLDVGPKKQSQVEWPRALAMGLQR